MLWYPGEERRRSGMVERNVWERGRRRVVILGAAGRDFHCFNTVYRDDPTREVVAFTAAQIPGISDRSYPAALAGFGHR